MIRTTFNQGLPSFLDFSHLDGNKADKRGYFFNSRLIKVWEFSERTIALNFHQSKGLLAYIRQADRLHKISRKWIIGVPLDVQSNRKNLSLYLQDTYCKLIPLEGGQFKLVICQRGKGGGSSDEEQALLKEEVDQAQKKEKQDHLEDILKRREQAHQVMMDFAENAKMPLEQLPGVFKKLLDHVDEKGELNPQGINGLSELITLAGQIVAFNQKTAEEYQKAVDSKCLNDILVFDQLLSLHFKNSINELDLTARQLQIAQQNQGAQLKRIIKLHHFKLEAEAKIFKHLTALAELKLRSDQQGLNLEEEAKKLGEEIEKIRKDIQIQERALENKPEAPPLLEIPALCASYSQMFGPLLVEHIKLLSFEMIEKQQISYQDIVVLENAIRAPSKLTLDELKGCLNKISPLSAQLLNSAFDLSQEQSVVNFYEATGRLEEIYQALDQLVHIKEQFSHYTWSESQIESNRTIVLRNDLSTIMNHIASIQQRSTTLKNETEQITRENHQLQLIIEEHVQELLRQPENQEIKAKNDLNALRKMGISDKREEIKRLENELEQLEGFIYQQQIAWSTYE